MRRGIWVDLRELPLPGPKGDSECCSGAGATRGPPDEGAAVRLDLPGQSAGPDDRVPSALRRPRGAAVLECEELALQQRGSLGSLGHSAASAVSWLHSRLSPRVPSALVLGPWRPSWASFPQVLGGPSLSIPSPPSLPLISMPTLPGQAQEEPPAGRSLGAQVGASGVRRL